MVLRLGGVVVLGSGREAGGQLASFYEILKKEKDPCFRSEAKAAGVAKGESARRGLQCTLPVQRLSAAH